MMLFVMLGAEEVQYTPPTFSHMMFLSMVGDEESQ